MHLILDIEEANELNRKEAIKRGCVFPTLYWWPYEQNDTQQALNVGNGDGLSKTRLKLCVDELPDDFYKEKK
jgi:hypothetical protein